MDATLQTAVRGVRRGANILKRDRTSWSALPAALGLLLLVQVVVLASFGAQKLHRSTATNVPLRLEMSTAVTNQRAHELLTTLNAQTFVADAAYVTREQALERARRLDPGLVASIEAANLDNPFTDTIALQLRSLNDATLLHSFLQQDAWKGALSPAGLKALTESLSEKEQRVHAAHVGTVATRIALAIAAIATLLVSTELVRRRMHILREDLYAQKLMGASPLMLLTPLATSMCILLLVATIVATVFSLAFLAAWPTVSESAVTLALRSEFLQMKHLPWFLIETGVIVVVGVAGTWLGMRVHMK